MTGIEGIGWPSAPRPTTRSAAKPGFFVPASPPETGQTAAAAAPQASSAASMLGLQELGEETVRDREARRHGQDMLAALAELQRNLLGAGDAAVALRRLSDLVAAVPVADDPRLAAMVAAVVLRVRVELARRQNTCVSAC